MKTKQLANVLIKVLGLSVVVHGIPAILTGLFNLLRVRGRGSLVEYLFFVGSSFGLAALGAYLIFQSRAVTDFLFKDEEE